MAGSTVDFLVPGTISTPGFFTMDPMDENETVWWNEMIHPYWRQWDIETMIPDSWHYAVAAWMTFFGIFGVLGNLLVIFTFTQNRKLRTPSNMLLINLAVGDMGFSAINGFPLLTISSINKKWVWGALWCKVYGFCGGIFGILSINTLCAIAYDRYSVIAKPMDISSRMTKKKAFIYLLIAWLNAALWSVPPFFGWGAYVPEGFQTSCTFDYLTQDINNVTFTLGMYIFGFFFPVFIIFYCYHGIVSAVFNHHKQLKEQAKKMGAKMTQADQEKKTEIQIAKVAATTVGTFMLSWTPYAVVGAIGMLTPHSKMIIHPLLSEIPVMFAKASACYNPLIYALGHPKFRVEIYKHFPWLLCCCKPTAKMLGESTVGSRTGSVMSKTEEMSSISSAGNVDIQMKKAGSTATVNTTTSGSSNPAGPNGQCT